MPEGDPSAPRRQRAPRDAGSPNTRGRRNPALAAQLNAPEPEPEDDSAPEFDDFGPGGDDREDMLAGAGEGLPNELPILFPGDVVMGKASVSTKVMGFEHWFTWGISSRVQPGEDAEEAFMRVGAQVSESVMDLAYAMEEKIIVEETRRQQAERNRPIRRRNSS